MTTSRRPTAVAALTLAVLAVSLAGCGRKGPLEAPPSAAATQTTNTTTTTAPIPAP